MTKIKICGIRREADVEYVNRYLPDYVGFIFAESKRKVSPEQAGILSGMLDKTIKKVGVFVNEDPCVIIQTAAGCGLGAVQVHGDETPEYFSELKEYLDGEVEVQKRAEACKKVEVWKAVRVKDRNSIDRMAEFDADCFVLDAHVESGYGGTGKSFDWNLAAEAKKYGNIILAGGLTPQNVEEAIKVVQPFGVDVSSGVETDGFKDESKVREFIHSVKRID